MADIIQNIDREKVRAQIRQNQEWGRKAIESLKECKKLSAGAVFKSGRAWLGRDVLEAQLERTMKKKRKEKEIVRKRLERRKRRNKHTSRRVRRSPKSKNPIGQYRS